MASKRMSTEERDPNTITVDGKPDEDQAVAIARTVVGAAWVQETCMT